MLGVTPFERPDARLAIALCRAGALGVLDLGRDAAAARSALDRLAARAAGPFAIRVATEAVEPATLPEGLSTVIIPAGYHACSPEGWSGRRVLV